MITLEWVKPNKIRETWPTIKEGLEAVGKTTDAWIIEDIYMSIMLGTCNLHLAMDKDEYKGFTITQQRENYGENNFHIWAAYSCGNDFDILKQSVEQIEVWAKTTESPKVTFSSTRKGWAKQALKLGFKPSPLITYEKRLS